MGLAEIIPLLVTAVGAATWIVKAIYSVRDEVKDMRIAVMQDMQSLRDELWEHVNDTSKHS